MRVILKAKYKILVISIIVIGLVLRLWNFNSLFYFAIDEEKGAYIIQGIANATHFPSVGHPSSIGVRLGPIFYYLMALFYKIFAPTPLTIGYLSIAASVISMALLYRIAKRISVVTAIFSLLLYSFSYLNVIYERRGWQLSFESPLILLIILSVLELRRGKEKFLFVLTAALILLTQFEVGLFNFIPLVIIAIFLFRLKINKTYLVISLLTVIIANSGLLVFDLRHQFLNTRYLLNYFKKESTVRVQPNVPLTGIRSVYLAHNLIPATFARTLFPGNNTNMAIQYANCPQYLKYKQSQVPSLLKLFIVVIILYAILYTIKYTSRKDDKSIILKLSALFFSIHFSAVGVYTYIFQGEMAEYYFIPSFVFFFISLGSILAQLYQTKIKLLVLLFLAGFSVVNIYTLIASYNVYGLKNKLDAVNFALTNIKDSSFILDAPLTCWSTGGYRYLFTLAKKEPLTSYMDQNLSEYYTPDKIHTPKYQVSIFAPELIGESPPSYREYKEKIVSSVERSENFGAIEIYISRL